MENNLQNTSGAPAQYQHLGNKAFWLFFLQISPFSIVLLILTIALAVFSLQPFLATTALGNLQPAVLNASLIAAVVFIIVTAISWTIAWLNYNNFAFLIGEDSIKIRRGILSKTEEAIPYRQIQNVDIERSFTFQMLGLSRVVILTAGHEDENPEGNNEAEGVIPALDKTTAEQVQTELLKRADLQKVVSAPA